MANEKKPSPDTFMLKLPAREYTNASKGTLYTKGDVDGFPLDEFIPVKIIPYDTWEKLMEWCDMMAKAHRRNLETLNCDDSLNEILEEVQIEEYEKEVKQN